MVISWSDGNTDGGSDTQTYRILKRTINLRGSNRRRRLDQEWKVLDSGIKAQEYKLESEYFNPGDLYEFIVQAENENRYSDYSDPIQL